MRSMLCTGGVMLLFGMLVVVGESLSEPKAPPAPKTRIGLINLAQLFKGYAKVASFNNENKKFLQPLQDKARKLGVQIDAHTKELENKDLSEDKRTEMDTQLTEYKRQLDDLTTEAKIAFTKKSEEQMVTVYKEIGELTKRYGKKHDFDMILHYNDVPVDAPEYFAPANVNRKIQAGAAIPLFLRDGVDITTDMLALLNDSYRAEPKPDDKEEP